MFKRITIELTEPICDCEKMNLGWTPVRHGKGYGVVLDCHTCGTSVTIPYEKFTARFVFDTPYPADQGELLTLRDGAPNAPD